MNTMLLTEAMDYSQPIDSLVEKLTFGGLIVLIGMVAIFTVLLIIYIALLIFKLCFQNVHKSDKIEQPHQAPAPIITHSYTADEEIVAVIAAAIAIAESENTGTKFRVVSFKRV